MNTLVQLRDWLLCSPQLVASLVSTLIRPLSPPPSASYKRDSISAQRKSTSFSLQQLFDIIFTARTKLLRFRLSFTASHLKRDYIFLTEDLTVFYDSLCSFKIYVKLIKVRFQFFFFQFGDDYHYDSVSYMLHMHVKCNWQNGVNQMVPPVQVNLESILPNFFSS